MTDIYSDGSYLKNNPSWHAEDSNWKVNQIMNILKKNNIDVNTICDIGCGCGEVLNQLYNHYSKDISYTGFEVSPQAFSKCQNKNNNISFYFEDFISHEGDYYDLLTFIDLVEHIEDLNNFLRKVKNKGEYKLFHVPLEFNFINIIKPSILINSIDNYGHTHFFSKELIIKILNNEGYTIIDFLYTPIFEVAKPLTFYGKLLTIPQKIAYSMSSDLGIGICGGSSLLLLTK